uniref:Uncharacterized protein n=1 Tax=Tetranychus urticae TaxID=32264 RepID=T1KQW1_TETUR
MAENKSTKQKKSTSAFSCLKRKHIWKLSTSNLLFSTNSLVLIVLCLMFQIILVIYSYPIM